MLESDREHALLVAIVEHVEVLVWRRVLVFRLLCQEKLSFERAMTAGLERIVQLRILGNFMDLVR